MKACVENGASCIDISGEPQVCELGKVLLCVMNLVKHLFVVFHVSVSVNMWANSASQSAVLRCIDFSDMFMCIICLITVR